ncbi:putative F-box domain, FBD domain, leucine-rich repeat domain, L domain-containing protein [Medicago truncatula]|uniref:F-box/RNI/FBD-like domain protein n=1 Tax=Medicago truncatula TaxID=3880 RepID=A0A072UAK7_MEDTR|nr:FBD-associated F-box protein At3g52670 [Medicago truncatula]KEH26143.1 F-box/RNI/FBD-like domain protein [Medicago truncatula]RHN51647.1 putative F-box domain, FBD domain, leucine-rich repeat domain, L domain-containing protein [Medicago truncatula]
MIELKAGNPITQNSTSSLQFSNQFRSDLNRSPPYSIPMEDNIPNLLRQPTPTHSKRASRVDSLNDFQDDILSQILSFLPIKDAFRTTILSKRWVSLCHSRDVHHFNDIQSGVNEIEAWIHFCQMLDAILLSPRAQQHTLKSFHLKCRYDFWQFDYSSINQWVETAIRRHVEDLSLFLLPRVTLTSAIFCCKTLVVLKLTNLLVATLFDCSVHLPLLKTLHLSDVRFDDIEDLKKLISGSPMLEDLKTAYVTSNIGVEVTAGGYSKTLSKLIKANIRLFDVPLRAVSNVQFLTVTGMGKSLPNQEINSYYQGCPVFENLIELRLFWFDNCIHDWYEVVQMLHNCPKLQSLSISKWTGLSTTNEIEDWKYPYTVPECVSSHLTTCKILDYHAIEADFRFVTYILRNARHLQVMEIHYRSTWNSMESPQFLEDLFSYPRISPACNLSFI